MSRSRRENNLLRLYYLYLEKVQRIIYCYLHNWVIMTYKVRVVSRFTLCYSSRMKLKLPSPKRLVCSAFPILRWSRTYDTSSAVGDLIAGVTVALTLVPQSIAYASLAGFEPQVLYQACSLDKIYAWLLVASIVLLGWTLTTSKALAKVTVGFIVGNYVI